MRFFGVISSGTRKKFIDVFSGSSINPGSDGSLWNSIRGSFTVALGKVSGSDTNYPIASINLPPDGPAVPPETSATTTISLKGASTGTGSSIWITDSNNWYAVASVQVASTVCDSCANCTSPLTCSGGYNGGGFYASGGTFSTCTNGCNNGFSCNAALSCNPGTITYNTVFYNGYVYNVRNCPGGLNICNTGFNCIGLYNKRFCPGGTNPNTGGCPPGYNGGGTCIGGFQCNAPRTGCSGGYNGGGNYASGGNYAAGGNFASCTNGCNNGFSCNAAPSCNPGTITYNALIYNTRTCPGGINVCNTGYGTAFACNCQPTTYPAYVRFLRSVGGVVSQLTQFLVGSLATSSINSLRLSITGSQITAKPYSDANLVNQVGPDLTYTPTGAAITTEYGIIVVPSIYNQTTEIDEISIEKG